MHRAIRILLLLGGMAGQSWAKEIETFATLYFQPDTQRDRVKLISNRVRLLVAESSFSLLDENFVLAAAGGRPVLPHRAINIGETSSELVFDVWNQGGNAFDLEGLRLYRDLNANGRFDPGEPELPSGIPSRFSPGEQLHLVIAGTVPEGAEAHSSTLVVIGARDPRTGLQLHRVDIVRVRPEGAGLLVSSEVSPSEAEVGDSVVYTTRVRNVSGIPLDAARLVSRLPAGFIHTEGSLRLDDVIGATATPEGSNGFVVTLPHLAPDGVATIRHHARIGSAALRGDGLHRAQAFVHDIESNVASTRVAVRDGVFTSTGVVLGRIFVDANGNGLPDGGERGLAGVRLYLEDGSYVITDHDGKYSFYGVSPRTHVLRLDATTLPPGITPEATTFRHAGGAFSRFVDLRRHELHRADFALSATPEALAATGGQTVAPRFPTEIERELGDRLSLDGRPIIVSDPRALPASGFVGAQGEPSRHSGIKSPDTTPLLEATPSEEDLLASLADNRPGFVGLRDGAVLPSAQTSLLVKGPQGARFSLAVNGAVIGEERVGMKAALPDRNIEVWKFIGLDLAPGNNRLRIDLLDPFGNPRGSETITVRAPGALAALKLHSTDASVGGGAPASVTVELVDALGTPVTARTPLTLQASLGHWLVDDLDPASPGVQVFVENGRHTFLLGPPLEPGEAGILASSGNIGNHASLVFQPDLRPLLAVGVIEGVLNFGAKGRGELLPAGSTDAFEEELRGLSDSSSDGRLGFGGRTAFYLKGKVRGDFLLTAAYDSDKPENARLFRDIQPGEYYPVYGDASIRGFDAQSTGRLYVRVDRNRSYALVGDFTTSSPTGYRPDDLHALGAYQRSFNGVKQHLETDRLRAGFWASEDSTRRFVGEIPAEGTSGPYVFDLRDVLANSERVELVTRDRHQPSRIISVRPLVRFHDYEFEPFTGRLLLTAPVPSVDHDLNPVSIRLAAEVARDGARFWNYGGDVQVNLNERTSLGVAYARDENPDNPYELASAGLAMRLAQSSSATVELAASSSEADGDGLAGRLEFRHRSMRTDAHLLIGRTETDFRNPGSLLLPGRFEGSYKVTHKLTSVTSFISHGVLSEDLSTGGRLLGARMDLERSFGPYRAAVGLRHSEETAIPANATGVGDPNTVNSARIRFMFPLPRLPRGLGSLEYERDVRHPDRQMAAAGFEYTFSSGGRAYARHEFISSLGGPFELNDRQRHHTTLVGIERSYMKDGQFFNEYRAGDEIHGREAEAVLGLRNRWRLAEGVAVATSFEHIAPFDGDRRDESSAVTGMLSYTRAPGWHAHGRLELRQGSAGDSVLNTLGYARQIHADWTLLGKTVLLVTDHAGPLEGRTVQGRAQAGFAWRPSKDTRWHALGKYEIRHESDDREDAMFARRQAHIISTDLNFQPDTRWTLSIHHAVKLVREQSVFGSDDHLAQLVATRATRRFGRRWEGGLNLSALGDDRPGRWRHAFGPELGVLLGKNLVVAVGYNAIGFKDRDLTQQHTTAEGCFVRFRLKFDETLLAGLGDSR